MQSSKIAVAAAAIAGMIGTTAVPAFAEEACKSMQVFLGITPNHREDVMAYIAPRLKEKLGVDLIAETIGSANMVERLSAQMPNPRVTLAHWDMVVGLTPCDQGMCEPIDLTKAPNAAGLYDWAYSKNKDGKVDILATNVLGIGLVYNEEEFKKNNIPVPTSWNDLARKELAGRISITAPASTWGTAELVQWAKMGGGGEGNIDPGFKFAQSLMPNMHTVHTWSSEMSNLMQLGEVWLAATGSDMAAAMRAKGLPVRWVMPKEGGPLMVAGVSLIKGAPCQEAAYEYLQLYYSTEFQLMRLRAGLDSTQPAAWAALPPEEKSKLDLTVNDFDKLVNFDWRTINANRPAWIQRWQREIH